MKIKTQDLIGVALDWAVAKCEEPIGGYKGWVQEDLDKGILHGMKYSAHWEWAGPLIEREKIRIVFRELEMYSYWFAEAHKPYQGNQYIGGKGQTPLVAAMRCLVASKLGDEVDIPEELSI